MRIINLKNDFGVDREKNKDWVADEQITANYINFAVTLAYKEGLNSDKRRMFKSIQDRLEKAVERGDSEFEVNEYEYMFIKGAFEKALVPTNETKMFTVTEAAVFEAKFGEEKVEDTNKKAKTETAVEEK